MKRQDRLKSLPKCHLRLTYPIKLNLYIHHDASVLSFIMNKPHGGSIWGLSKRNSIIMAGSFRSLRFCDHYCHHSQICGHSVNDQKEAQVSQDYQTTFESFQIQR